MQRLTQSTIDRSKYEGNPAKNERDVRWDPLLPGFGVRVYPSNRKTFVISYRACGRKRLMTVGRYGVLTLDQAKRKARALLVDVANQRDPLEELQSKINSDTVAQLAEKFMKSRSENKSASEDQRRLDKFLLPRWRLRKATSITHQEVVRLHGQLGDNSIYEANRVVALISVMFNFAKSNGFIARTDDNPAEGIKKFAEKKRKRFLSEEELPRLAKAIKDYGDIYIEALIWLFLFLGCRRSELLTAKWEYVDLSKRVLKLPDTKNGEPFTIHLSDPAIKWLQKIPREPGNPYIFPGRGNSAGQGRHLSNLDKYWIEIRKTANLEDVHIHDLRRTFASWMAQSGTSLHLISKALNHSGIEITAQHYAHLSVESVRAPIDLHATSLLKASRKKTPQTAAEKISP